MRGFIYTIEKQRFWMMGGARSIDITDGLFDKEDPLLKEKILDLKRQGKNYYRIRGINWFPEEMPSEEELERGMECLRKNGDGDRLYHYPWGACHGVKLFFSLEI